MQVVTGEGEGEGEQLHPQPQHQLIPSDFPYVTITKLPASGRLIVTLNGTTYPNCTVSRDCPGASVCYYNATWSAFPRQCACWTFEQLGGYLCEDRTATANGRFLVATRITNLVINVILAIVAFLVAMQALKQHRKKKRRVLTALNFTLLFALLAPLIVVSLDAMWLMPYTIGYDTAGNIEFRPASVTTAMNVCLVASYFFYSLAALNVSIVWLRGFSRSSAFISPRLDRFVFSYTTICIIYYTSFLVFTLYYVVIVGSNRTVAPIFATLSVAYILITYGLGYFWLRSYMATHKATLVNDTSLTAHLRLVSNTALAMSIMCGILCALLIGYFASGTNTSNTPLAAPALLFLELFHILVSLALVIVLVYLAASLRLKERNELARRENETQATVPTSREFSRGVSQ